MRAIALIAALLVGLAPVPAAAQSAPQRIAATTDAPVVLRSPNGRIRTYGRGAANAAARGAALLAAVDEAATGQAVYFYGPGQFDVGEDSLVLAEGVSLIGVGRPLISAGDSGDAAVVVAQDDITLAGFDVMAERTGIGALTHPTTCDVRNLVVRDVRCLPNDEECNGAYWDNVRLIGEFQGCTFRSPEAAGGAGFGFYAVLHADSRVRLVDCDVFGDTDGVFAAGSTGAIVDIDGGSYASTLDAITSNGATIRVRGARARGDQADLYGDGGSVSAWGSDVREAMVVGDARIMLGSAPLSEDGTDTAGFAVVKSVTPGDIRAAVKADAICWGNIGPLESGGLVANAATYLGVGGAVGFGTFAENGVRTVIVPRSGIIRYAAVRFFIAGGLGTSETSSIYLRRNESADALISSAVNMSTANPFVSSANVNLSVSAGDRVAIKWVTPTWSTRPGNVYATWSFCVE